jgi:hypothetical protein
VETEVSGKGQLVGSKEIEIEDISLGHRQALDLCRQRRDLEFGGVTGAG